MGSFELSTTFEVVFPYFSSWSTRCSRQNDSVNRGNCPAAARRVARGCKDGPVTKRYLQVPELIVGFDTETTGLDVTVERAISYGFCEYRYGVPVSSEHYYVVPDRPISEGARRVHGLSLEDLESKRLSNVVYSVEEGLRHTMDILRRYEGLGALLVGSNLSQFDIEMFRWSYRTIVGRNPEQDGLHLSNLRIIDVVEHDLVIEPSRSSRPRRGLDYLCRHYGVQPGGHDALNDARAAVEVFFEQVLHNNAGQMSLDIVAQPSPSLRAQEHHDA
jgi:DNA polymerase-3 subunit epsilon